MSSEIKNLEPKVVWEYFYDLTQVPRPSKDEDKIQDFMMNFGKSLGLETIKDETGNIIIKKPATAGMEDRQGVVLQAHLDMVPQANSDTNHDFSKDPIDAYIDGEWVTARGTTLGADNGMGVAAAMAILSSKDIQHGPIEGLFTCDEETGMTGAFGLQPNVLDGDILMNLDSEDEGELYVGCAGGVDGTFYFDIKQNPTPDNYVAFKLSVKGLKGGHSGMDIIQERGNANKIIFRFISEATDKYELRLCDIDGGSLRNAIPREAFATVIVPKGKEEELKKHVEEFQAIVQKELSSADPGVVIEAKLAPTPEKVFSDGLQSRLTKAINGCPNGVIRMSQDMIGLVETSSNLAAVKIEGTQVSVQCLIRSSVDSAKDEAANSIASVFALADARPEFTGAYPGWKPNMDSAILKAMQKVYENMHNRTPEIKAIHAGLECGLLGGVYPNWDMISFGPTIRNPHSPDEKVNIETVGMFFNWLVESLKTIPKK